MIFDKEFIFTLSHIRGETVQERQKWLYDVFLKSTGVRIMCHVAEAMVAEYDKQDNKDESYEICFKMQVTKRKPPKTITIEINEQ